MVKKLLQLEKVKKKIIMQYNFLQKSSGSIISSMVGHKFKVYQGNRFIPVTVTKKMVGSKFGMFLRTRKLHVFKKKK